MLKTKSGEWFLLTNQSKQEVRSGLLLYFYLSNPLQVWNLLFDERYVWEVENTKNSVFEVPFVVHVLRSGVSQQQQSCNSFVNDKI